jgi:hypothetical protein
MRRLINRGKRAGLRLIHSTVKGGGGKEKRKEVLEEEEMQSLRTLYAHTFLYSLVFLFHFFFSPSRLPPSTIPLYLPNFLFVLLFFTIVS